MTLCDGQSWQPISDCLRKSTFEIDRRHTNRRHYHFLFTGRPVRAVSVKTCITLKVRWEELGGGFAHVSESNPALNGVNCITKCLEHELSRDDCYESAKFGGGTCDLMLSKAVWKASNHARRQTGR